MRTREAKSIIDFLKFRPVVVGATLGLTLLTAVLEGLGIGFILPIVKLAQKDRPVEADSRFMEWFLQAYDFLGVPFELEYVVFGVVVVLFARYSMTFVVGWLKSILSTKYQSHLKTRLLETALETDVALRDKKGSDKILNSIVTETNSVGSMVSGLLDVFRLCAVSMAYLLIAISLNPLLTVFAFGTLGILTYVTRSVVASGSKYGDEIATQNENMQQYAQVGIQGLREVKLYNLTDEIINNFNDSVDGWVTYSVNVSRNKSFVNTFYNFTSAVTLFIIIYIALEHTGMSLGALGVFLFAMLRLAPRASNLNSLVYNLESRLPHLDRVLTMVSDLEGKTNRKEGSESAPDPVTSVTAEDITFSYDGEENSVKNASFSVETGEFIAFVGKSGAGKSTLVSLLARLYDPDSGEIRANGEPLTEIDPADWRSRIAVVLQQPYMFDDTLRYNLTIGNREASEAEIDRACRIARVDEFIDELPEGYDTMIGENGVRLSGGQKQRVALARAVLKKPDVLILDEATSDLDNVLETEIQEQLMAMDRDFAMIAVAHRLSTIIDADRIYAMEDGRIVEEGSHDQLIENGQHYANLYASN